MSYSHNCCCPLFLSIVEDGGNSGGPVRECFGGFAIRNSILSLQEISGAYFDSMCAFCGTVLGNSGNDKMRVERLTWHCMLPISSLWCGHHSLYNILNTNFTLVNLLLYLTDIYFAILLNIFRIMPVLIIIFPHSP